MVDRCRSKIVHVVSGMPRDSVLGSLIFLLHTSELISHWKIGYADDSTLIAVVPSPVVRIAVAESQNRYLGRVSEWCDLCGMKLIRVKLRL